MVPSAIKMVLPTFTDLGLKPVKIFLLWKRFIRASDLAAGSKEIIVSC